MTVFNEKFKQHIHDTFGDGADSFSDELLERLQHLWLLGNQEDLAEAEAQEKARKLAMDHGHPKIYPATTGKWTPEWPVSSDRDRSRPACPSCGGRGLGDYPYPCDSCGGTGNG